MSELCKNCACENVCGITHTPEDKACEFYKAEAFTELEKIKAEIEEKEFKLNCATMSDVALKTAYSEVAKLLDNHISELKGENK